MTRQFTWASTLIALLFAAGCSHGNVRPDESSTPTPAPTPSVSQEQMGPPLPPGGVPDQPEGPQPPPDFTPPQDGYVLVLGPGLARTYAYVGVLREMEARSLPIRAVVGVEMGAVVGSIWASSSINNLEWEMHKFQRDTLLDFPMLGLGDRVAEGKRLYKFLDDALKVSLLQKMKVPTVVVSSVQGSDGQLVESTGSAKDILRGTMGIPGLIKPYGWEGKDRVTAAAVEPFPVSEARNLGLGKVVCVDVLGRGDNFKVRDSLEAQLSTLMRSEAAVARQELKDCDSVITVAVDGIGYLDFDAKADLSERGRTAVRKWMEPAK